MADLFLLFRFTKSISGIQLRSPFRLSGSLCSVLFLPAGKTLRRFFVFFFYAGSFSGSCSLLCLQPAFGIAGFLFGTAKLFLLSPSLLGRASGLLPLSPLGFPFFPGCQSSSCTFFPGLFPFTGPNGIGILFRIIIPFDGSGTLRFRLRPFKPEVVFR